MKTCHEGSIPNSTNFEPFAFYSPLYCFGLMGDENVVFLSSWKWKKKEFNENGLIRLEQHPVTEPRHIYDEAKDRFTSFSMLPYVIQCNQLTVAWLDAGRLRDNGCWTLLMKDDLTKKLTSKTNKSDWIIWLNQLSIKEVGTFYWPMNQRSIEMFSKFYVPSPFNWIGWNCQSIQVFKVGHRWRRRLHWDSAPHFYGNPISKVWLGSTDQNGRLFTKRNLLMKSL